MAFEKAIKIILMTTTSDNYSIQHLISANVSLTLWMSHVDLRNICVRDVKGLLGDC